MANKPPPLQRKKFEKQKSIKNAEGHPLDYEKTDVVQNVILESVSNSPEEIESQEKLLSEQYQQPEQQLTKEIEILPSPNIEEKISTNNLLKIEQPKQKTQSTSPNLPIQEYQTQLDEVTKLEIPQIKTICEPPASATTINNNNSVTNNNIQEVKKEEFTKPVPSTIPVMGYTTTTTGYSAIDNNSVFQGVPNGTYPTYQQGADGSVYALQQPMMYAYPPQMVINSIFTKKSTCTFACYKFI